MIRIPYRNNVAGAAASDKDLLNLHPSVPLLGRRFTSESHFSPLGFGRTVRSSLALPCVAVAGIVLYSTPHTFDLNQATTWL